MAVGRMVHLDDSSGRSGGSRRVTRREALLRCANGFGGLALGALLGERAYGAFPASPQGGPLRPRRPHFRARARSVIFLYMDGGPSQVDTWDPKPTLQREDGKPFPWKKDATQFNDNGNTLGSPWKFSQHGESGIPVSELFPHIASCVDELAVIRSMYSEFPEHTNANYFLHTGVGLQGRPSHGAWIGYGLGTVNQDLPGFVVINGGLIPPGGLDNFGNGFLPASFQGSVFAPRDQPVANIAPREASPAVQRNKLALMGRLDAALVERAGADDALESASANYELALRMQTAVPELAELAGEPEAVRTMYGMDARYGPTRTYAAQCVLARRLVERGVRFVELTCPGVGADRWDQHSKLREGHANNARAVDQPIAALLVDLKQRGLLDETLVVWCGEFGRTPFAQGRDGRDHNPSAFSIWMAGGGVRGGVVHGATDEYGYRVVEDPVSIHDLHATILHLLGVDHERLTYRFSGRDIRLTDVHGEIVRPILA